MRLHFFHAPNRSRRISSQIGWLTQNSEPSSQPADPRDGARDGLDAPAHRSAPGLTSRTRSGQRQVDISRQLSRRRRLQAANYKDRGSRLHRPVVVASPAGRTGLREARAAPDCAPAVLLSSPRASDCASLDFWVLEQHILWPLCACTTVLLQIVGFKDIVSHAPPVSGSRHAP